ncbi:MAG: signal peptidase I [Thermoanaerobaculia bacterium]|jgi:signal peptidase I|nr:signal peptidase I [Thermoanaerobaculia bacterium]MBP9826533.1 signal peptidase I [Thermoanaerobaculia bacterium]
MSTAPRSTAREYLEALLIAAVFLLFTNTFVIKTFFIPSGSMEDTLLVGDHLFVNRFIFGPTMGKVEQAILPLRVPRRGDIVVFRSPERPNIDLVKRLIGLPGDTIQVVDKQLFVNGKKVVDDAYVEHKDPRIFQNRPYMSEQQRLRDNFGPVTVPAASYFCMGDNRDLSYDSRFWGVVPEHYIKGRAFLIYWSFGGGTSDGTWRGAGAKLRELANTALGFLTKTRWTRSFHLPS